MDKQYILMCNEQSMEALGKIFKPEAIQFLEVQGMNLTGVNSYNILVTPIIPPLPQANVTPPEAAEIPQEPEVASNE